MQDPLLTSLQGVIPPPGLDQALQQEIHFLVISYLETIAF